MDGRAEIEISRKPDIELAVRLITLTEVDKGRFINDACVMSKRVETVLAVILSHSAFADAAEPHCGGNDVNIRFIDAAAAKAAGRMYFFYIRLA